MALPPGTRINDRYVILDYLGQGAAGAVYRVTDEHLANEVALKLLHPRPGQPTTWDEAQRLEQLRSDFLLPVINADIVHGSDIRFITSPVMSGGDLADAAKPHGVGTRQAVRWGQQLSHGLERVHVAGLVHRDVKPGNAFLDANDVLLGDLGMAALLDGTGRAAPDGTPATAAPEVLSGGHTSILSDIYSLGATMFYVLCGEYPVDHRLPRPDLVAAAIAGRRQNLRDLAPHVSLGLARVVDRALSLNPSGRHSSALAFANALATANHHAREWVRISPHPGHHICLSGGPRAAAQAISVCVIPNAARFDVVVQAVSGQRQRRHEVTAIPPKRLAATLRTLTRTA